MGRIVWVLGIMEERERREGHRQIDRERERSIDSERDKIHG